MKSKTKQNKTKKNNHQQPHFIKPESNKNEGAAEA
jgi:hypothetical protein